MFSQLDEAFGSLEFEDSGLARITAMAHEADGLRLQIHVEFGADGVAAQTWELACRQVGKLELCRRAVIPERDRGRALGGA